MKSLRDLERKTRANIIKPVIDKLQELLSNRIFSILNKENIHTSEELNKFFENKKVAIVGNSPNLEGSKKGEKIDSHDIVIRFNRGILKSDIEDLGERCDIWSTGMLDTLCNKEIRKFSNSESLPTLFIPLPFNGEEKSNGINIYMLEKTKPFKDKGKVYISSEHFSEINSEVSKDPSSGYVMIQMINKFMNPKSVTIYGFSFSSNNRITGDTYAKQHNFSEEEEIIMGLIEANEKFNLHT